MPPSKLTETERLGVTLRALRGEGPSDLAREYGVTRGLVYHLRDAALRLDADEAREELRLRREILAELEARG